ncbi:maleylacetoacetate isomerase [Ophiocordyceps camponoti-floridani]|uniref:Maleylacetoacetate isomerase n=1 Tax=Ophiocordyceps camponoti-floridani TaxID=2030778 RepID=A0A8H4VGI1_9HYPO|nr:maleylacetoacetate isomerase [Ophiocordyceps camponoti-floridani]
MPQDYKLYSYCRSSCSARLRIALNIKSIPYEIQPVNLLLSEQHSDSHRALNPSCTVPLLVPPDPPYPGFCIGQSVAALEYLEERHPETPLLPPADDLAARAIVRALVAIVCADIQPVTNLRVMRRVSALGGDAQDWSRQFTTDHFRAFDTMAESHAGTHCVGNSFTMADVVLIPAVWNAQQRFGVDISAFPTISRVFEALNTHPAVVRANYFNQPDTPAEMRASK